MTGDSRDREQSGRDALLAALRAAQDGAGTEGLDELTRAALVAAAGAPGVPDPHVEDLLSLAATLAGRMTDEPSRPWEVAMARAQYHQKLGDRAAEEGALAEALELADGDLRHHTMRRLASIAAERGDLASAERLLREVIDDESDGGPDRAADLAALAALLRAGGRDEEALEIARQRAELGQGSSDSFDQAIRLADVADLAAKTGRLDEAAAAYDQSIGIARRSQHPRHHFVGRLLGRLADVRLRQGRSAEAADLLREALDVLADPVGSPRDEARLAELRTQLDAIT